MKVQKYPLTELEMKNLVGQYIEDVMGTFRFQITGYTYNDAEIEIFVSTPTGVQTFNANDLMHKTHWRVLRTGEPLYNESYIYIYEYGRQCEGIRLPLVKVEGNFLTVVLNAGDSEILESLNTFVSDRSHLKVELHTESKKFVTYLDIHLKEFYRTYNGADQYVLNFTESLDA